MFGRTCASCQLGRWLQPCACTPFTEVSRCRAVERCGLCAMPLLQAVGWWWQAAVLLPHQQPPTPSPQQPTCKLLPVVCWRCCAVSTPPARRLQRRLRVGPCAVWRPRSWPRVKPTCSTGWGGTLCGRGRWMWVAGRWMWQRHGSVAMARQVSRSTTVTWMKNHDHANPRHLRGHAEATQHAPHTHTHTRSGTSWRWMRCGGSVQHCEP